MRVFIIALISLLLLPLTALAQTEGRPNTILVLDASGSMWGQIDEVNKIVIARDVIAEMLADMEDDVSLGLTVYGHRERGSCGDIETIVAPATGTQSRILEAVNSINPRGRTPMTDAVVAAAQALRSTEEAATVILVSDGIENCNPDPCAMAAELEAAGIDFTAHVIGFDVAAEPEARAQMQCIADNTGGQFLTADNAAELSEALEQVVAVTPTMMRIEAGIPPEFNMPTRPVTWTLLDAGGAVIRTGVPGPFIEHAFLPGQYVAQATRQEPGGPQTYQTSFTVVQGQTDLVVVAMPAIVETAQMTFTAVVEPEMSAPTSELTWTLSDASGATLLGPVVAPGGNVDLLPGDYRLEVVRARTGTRHEARFTMEAGVPQQVTIPLPAMAVEVSFVARIGDVGGVTITDPVIWDIEPLMSNPSTVNPTSFLLRRGAYRVTAYWTVAEIEQSVDFVVVDQPREIIVVFPEQLPLATLTAPASAVAGSTTEVGWTGPDNAGDFIAITPVEAEGYHRAANSTRTEDGSPLDLLMPPTPGDYVIEYVSADGRVRLASVPFTVTPATATITAPASAVAGATIEVGWTGPNYAGDFIAVTAVDAEGYHRFENTTRTEDGSPLDLLMPTEPGDYVIEYVFAQDRARLVAVPLTVTDATATITAPASATAGATIEVGWTGPDNAGDFIAVTAVDAEGYHRFENTTRTEEGSPLDLLMPTEPGDYVIEYALSQDRARLVAVPLTVTDATATITAPASAIAGATIEVGWTGPDYAGDFIAVTAVDAEGYHRFENTTRTEDGSPLDLLMPTEPGDYVIEYALSQDRARLVAVPLTVTDATATITAPASATAGATIEVGWTGPDNAGDFIAVTALDAEGYHRFENTTRTEDGSPLDLLMPTEPGDYVIEYALSQDRARLVAVPLTVTDATATITAPASAIAGATIEVGWTGPDYAGDFIAVTAVDAEGYTRFENTTRTEDGSPLDLVMPTEPGDYVIEYALSQDRSRLVAVPITITQSQASIIAPATAVAGSTIEVAWTGPDYAQDYIGIGRVGADGAAQWENYVYTEEGAVLDLVVPPTPGTYLIRYFLRQDRSAIAEVEIAVTPAAASVVAQTSLVGGSTIKVDWTGPDYDGDYIGIGRVDAEGSAQWERYTYTEDGTPVDLRVPSAPGTYMIRYFMAQDRTVLAEMQVEVTQAAATLTAAATAQAGGTMEVAWTGPDFESDYIALGRAGATGSSRWEAYTYTENGSPLTINVPDEPGSYVLRYFISLDRTILAEQPVTVQ